MERPPFKLAQASGARHNTLPQPAPLTPDACCTAPAHSARAPQQRVRLTELDAYFHCSIIGTCLSTAELRRLIPRFSNLDGQSATDLEIHHHAVQLAGAGGAAAKALQKALDTRFEATLKRFKSASDDVALSALWREALDQGDVPGAYWALISHPHASYALRQLAFGDVHMLSHLVGAANRADIRRLVALEAETAELKDKVERQQRRLQEISAQRDAALKQVAEQARRQAAPQPTELDRWSEVTRLHQSLDERDRRLALHTARRQDAEQRALQETQRNAQLEADMAQLRAISEAAHAELRSLEETLSSSLDTQAADGMLASLKDKHIVYVGGRPNSNAILHRLVGAVGGALTLHDGGIEDRRGRLAAVLPRADLVVFPVDCIGHDAMATLKRVCARHGVDYYPLRTASVASFVDAAKRWADQMQAAAPTDVTPTSTAPVSRFCLRHG